MISRYVTLQNRVLQKSKAVFKSSNLTYDNLTFSYWSRISNHKSKLQTLEEFITKSFNPTNTNCCLETDYEVSFKVPPNTPNSIFNLHCIYADGFCYILGSTMIRSINQYVDVNTFKDYLSVQQDTLPELPEVTDLTPCVTRILGDNPGPMQLQGTNTYLLGSDKGRLLIDTGEGKPRWASLISAAVAERGINIEQVLLTHWHGDHTEGVPELVKLYPHLQHAIFKYDPDLGQQPIVDGQVFSVQGATVRAVYTPGHSTDHVCFLLEEEGALFTGDNILGHGTTVVEDLAEYQRSLQKMQAEDCAIGYPGHGAVIGDFRCKMKNEMRQKRRREHQVLMGLKSFQPGMESVSTNDGRATVKELVVQVFGQLPPSVQETVVEPFVSELLMKLASEKRVGFEFKGGQKRWFSKV